MTPSGLTPQFFDSIDAIDSDEWREITQNAFIVNREVLACVERGPAATRYHYLILRDGEAWQAAIVMSETRYGIAGLAFGRAGDGLARLPVLGAPMRVCGSTKSPLFVRTGVDWEFVVSSLLDALERDAQERGYGICFQMLEGRAELSQLLRRRGYVAAAGLPETKIDIDWTNRDSYLKWLRRRNRGGHRTAKHEINRFAKSGIAIENWDGREEAALYRLFEGHHKRLNADPYDMPSDFLSQLVKASPERYRVFVARRDGQAVGVFVAVISGDQALSWKIGVDHNNDGGNFTYFNLAYYHLFEIANELGVKTVWFGNAALPAKRRRGCDVNPTQIWFRASPPWAATLLRPAFAFQQRWYRRKFAPLLSPPT